jgi:peptidoglycan biosynthesis protein MviN/MurJ (putative lipid II flippase)
MRLYSPVLLFGAIGAVVWKGFYAKQLTGTATAIDITGIALYGVLLIIGTRMAGIDGIALAMSGYFVALTIMAGVVFFKRAGFAMTDLESPMLLKIAVSSVSLLITGWIMRQLISQDSFIALAVITAAAALAYVVSARLLRVPEAVKVVGTLERVYAAASRYR